MANEGEIFQAARRPALFFMHVPKTAGTSMRAFLSNQYFRDDVFPKFRFEDLLLADLPRMQNYHLIQGHFRVNILGCLPPGIRTLTLLRNPLNRTLSSIRHLVRDPNFHRSHGEVRGRTIQEILRDERIMLMHANAQTAYLSSTIEPSRGLSHIEGSGGSRDIGEVDSPANLDLAIANLERFHFVGVIENLSPLLSRLCRAMNFHPATYFPLDNAAPEGPTDHTALTEADTRLLEEYNQLDLKLYRRAAELAERMLNGLPNVASDPWTEISRLCDAHVYRRQGHSFSIDLSGPIPGSGWYEPERGASLLRWTGPYRHFSLEVPISPTGDFQCNLAFFSARSFDQGNFQASVNGLQVAVELSSTSRNMYLAAVPVSQQTLSRHKGVCQIIFDTGSVFRPSDSGGADQRSLGVAVIGVEFQRLGDPSLQAPRT